MARRTTNVLIDIAGRDHGKTFVITEMAASDAERWATRALLALGRSGVDLPEDISRSGLAGVAALGVRAFAGLPWELAEPLLNEMFRCVTFMPDASRPGVVRQLIEDDIEEVATRLKLREEVISLHVNFSIAGWISKFRRSLAEKMEDTSSTEISPSPLVE